jgi:esterase/lipase
MVEKVMKSFDEIARRSNDVMITGHILGGALAVVAASHLKVEGYISQVKVSVYMYGQPKLVNNDFRKSFNER